VVTRKILALVLVALLVVANVAAFADDNSNLGAPYDGDTHSDTTFVGVADNATHNRYRINTAKHHAEHSTWCFAVLAS
jgi:hypothetical protein